MRYQKMEKFEGKELLKKHHHSLRIPGYVVNYCVEHNISLSELCMRGFDFFRSTDRDHALSRLEYHRDRVLHWEGIVLQNKSECATKQHILGTVKDLFDKNNRNMCTKRENMVWFESKAEDLLKQGIIVSIEELYDFCIKKEG